MIKTNKTSKNNARKVLFVCNGNVFRSFSAECLLRLYLNRNKINGWEIFSAGTTAKKQEIDSEVMAKLKSFGVIDTNHKQHRLNKSMLKKFDLIIAMAEDQVDFMKKQFNYACPFLFNELVCNKKSSIWDIDTVKDYRTNRKGVKKEINKTIQYINNSIPKLVAGINKLHL
jgi:protein-tyrosine-phosphatase